MSQLVLIVDDEADLLSTLAFNLEREGWQTRTAQNGADAIAAALRVPHPDLIVLDLMLPDMPGTHVCKTVKSNPNTAHIPVLMLTARGEEIDRVVGFEVGADDYVLKPFSVRELTLRIKAILRRATTKPDPANATVFGRLRFDPVAHVVSVDDKPVSLTALEFRLLETFCAHKGQVQTREALLHDVWNITVEIETRTVDTHVKRLREKLGAAGDYIETLRGVGYRFRESAGDGGAA
jgi:two-component system, OmpR family, phosphate regulon response regulator PhoB